MGNEENALKNGDINMEKTIDERKDVKPEKIFETYFAHMSTAVPVTGVYLEVY